MERKKIKIDLHDFLNTEENVDIKKYVPEAMQIIKHLYETKDKKEAMTGWLNLPHEEKMYEEVENFSKKLLEEEKYEQLLVLGIGGSSLGPQALLESLNTPLWNRLSRGKRKGFLTVDFIDNLDPQIIRTTIKKLDLKKTFILVVSKGGGTLETIVPMLLLKEEMGDSFFSQCAFITTEGKGILYEIGKEKKIPLFSIPENVGGRFSIFSPVGLLPGALAGLNLKEIREGIKEADRKCKQEDIKENIGLMLAISAYVSYRNGKNILALMPYSTCMRKLVDWFVQLWAESLGKAQKGSTPIPAVGATDQHSQLQMFNEGPNDKLICFVKIQKHKRDLMIPDFSFEHKEFSLYAGKKVGEILNMELEATKKALTERKKSNILITLPELDEYYISELMYFFEMATAITGKLLGVNPFDQPGVELAKKYTKEALLAN